MHKINFKELILFENEDYIIINKPSGISTLDDRNEENYNIKVLAKNYWEDAQVCHRLDKETSGALAIAKNQAAYRSLAIQFEKREVQKIYHAVVDGVYNFQEKTVKLPILPLKKGIVCIDREKGKEAETLFNTLKAYRQHTLVECAPYTGRMHQIRIHLSVIKAPISGDEQYGGKPVFLSKIKRKFNLKKGSEEQPLMKRVALHAHSIGFKLLNGEEKKVTAPYPKDLTVLIKQLEKNI
ncbi:RluA family pseudouridine synthase [Xanthovirga aplysinae]|uniref:RluA family pseudouridine synthase n=1 Tax=Xanthovirga aplysinae TaxID=2529853 RepID=UPI0012BD29B0|nr:pseudouridine synthase [Xanthovirga aplysinae]MTI33413.1 RNA pseudouridine synthase [Xanthovirga aplysinae]